MLRSNLYLLLFCFGFVVSGQNQTNDIALISETVNNYFDGYIARDIQKLEKAFDIENGIMKFASEGDDGTTIFENLFFRDLVKSWATKPKLTPQELQACRLDILNVDVVGGEIATCKIKMTVEGTTFIDILSLQRQEESWVITNKIFVVEGS